MRSSKRGTDSACVAAAGMLLLALALHIADGALRRGAEPEAAVRVEARQVNFGTEYLIYDIRTPVVSGFADAEFAQTLHKRIEAQIASDRAEAESYAGYFYEEVKAGRMPPYDCVFTAAYEAKCTTGILSLKVTTFLDNGGTGMPHTVYYNADIKACEMLTLHGLFISGKYKRRIEAIIEAEMRKDPERYDVPFKGVTDDTQFFVSDGRLFIAFAKYEVAGGMTGEPEFEIPAEAFYALLKDRYTCFFTDSNR